MDEQQPGEPHATPKMELDPPVPARYASVTPQEIADGKAMAILSYAITLVAVPFFLVPLIMRNNEFSLFHSKQAMMIWIAYFANAVVFGLLFWTCVVPIISSLIVIALLVLLVIGIINSANGQFKPLPVIGPWGESWFAGITKATPPA